MVLPLDELTREQKCAAFGIGVDFSGIVQSQDKMDLLADYMDDFRRNLGIRRAEIEEFMQKMESGGRLSYAINVLKTNQNNRALWATYEWLYKVAAILESQKTLEKLDSIYINDFGWTAEKIQEVRKSYNLDDTISVKPKATNRPGTNSGKNGGCVFLALTILSSFIFSFVGLLFSLM